MTAASSTASRAAPAALVLPSAPVLVCGLAGVVSPELRAAQDAVHDVVRAAPSGRPVVLVVAGEPGVAVSRHASLRAVGRADLARTVVPAEALAAVLAGPVGWTVRQTPELDLSAAVLTLLGAFAQPVVTLGVPPAATSQRLRTLAGRLAVVLDETDALLVTAAGDGAAALAPRAPLTDRPEAHAWQRRYVAAVARSDGQALAALGPTQAQRLSAWGWAPAVALSCLVETGVCAAPRLRYAGAPHGVGYVVAG